MTQKRNASGNLNSRSLSKGRKEAVAKKMKELDEDINQNEQDVIVQTSPKGRRVGRVASKEAPAGN